MNTAPLIKIPQELLRRLQSPVAAAAALTLGLRVGQELYRVASGEISLEQFKKRTGLHVGTVTGTVGGAVAGAVAGRWLPGIGTLLGAFSGGLVGQFAGAQMATKGAERLVPRPSTAGLEAEDELEAQDEHDDEPPLTEAE